MNYSRCGVVLVMATEETVSDDGSGGLILEWQILDIGKKQQDPGVQFSKKELRSCSWKVI